MLPALFRRGVPLFRAGGARALSSRMGDVDAFINDMNDKYAKLHRAFEDNFWATKMGLKGCSAEELTRTKGEYDAFLRSKDNLAAVRARIDSANPEQAKILKIMERTFKCYLLESPEAEACADLLTKLEAELQMERNKMKLGYTDPKTGEFREASSKLLVTIMERDEDEAMRKACFEGRKSIGPFVIERFAEIVKHRNRLGKLSGATDFFDMKLKRAENMSKDEMFAILNDLEEKTRPLMLAARKRLAEEKGEDALLPWNTSHMLAGNIIKLKDPYYRFEHAVDVWARTYAALGINYRGATMNLDLCDRQGKYSNGFCHWPIPAYRKLDGTWIPSQTNFTSLATPSAIGSGFNALHTLLHEGGHAAHFANIDQKSPFFSQERAPMSVAYAENQSMFLDALCGDLQWVGRYAKNDKMEVIPWEINEKGIKQTHPYAVRYLRGMIAVPFFEKELYELPEDQVTPENIMRIAEEVELKIQGGPSSRPLLSVPHILTDESSAYYQGYVLAEMSVYHTRRYFKEKYGRIADNPKVGEELTEHYWKPGNSVNFLDLVKNLTGKPLTADAWVERLQMTTDERLEEAQKDYDEGVASGPKYERGQDVDLGMTVRFVHGDELIADTSKDGGLAGALQKFREWLPKAFPPEAEK